MRVLQELEYRTDVCRVTRGAHIEISSCQKNYFSFHVAVNNSIKVRPLVFLLQMFLITENITKHPVYRFITQAITEHNTQNVVTALLVSTAKTTIRGFYLIAQRCFFENARTRLAAASWKHAFIKCHSCVQFVILKYSKKAVGLYKLLSSVFITAQMQ
jgi:hypothetical protein